MSDVLTDWLAELAAALDLDAPTIDTALVLDIARDAARGVARPAAPLTTFLVGLAVGRRGGDRAALEHAATIAQHLAAEHGRRAASRPTES
jgi:hypothetical protein